MITSHPKIIQGGMGVAVSGWHLARTVSRLGQLGVVSGTALAVVLARRLQLGDPDGAMRDALKHFPFPQMAEQVIAQHYIPGGKSAETPFRLTAMPTIRLRRDLLDLTVIANFVEVFLAKQGHSGLVGINYLEKIQIPTLPSIYGAMLAGVDYIIMGAGIPRAIPGVMDQLSRGERVELKLDVEGAGSADSFATEFDPREFCGGTPPSLKRPYFLGIVASATLAMTLAKKASGQVDGFVVEGPTAGGHNAPPRGAMQLTPSGEPLYGPRDAADLDKIRALGLPFWLAGSYGRPGKLAEALQLGAAGIQVGTAFAFCEESGILPELRQQAFALSRKSGMVVFTDPLASPTGFPFKLAKMPGSLSQPEIYAARERICDLGYLRHPYLKTDGSIGYRCPAEPPENFLRKGGRAEELPGRKCICNGLSATVGLGQFRAETGKELPVVTGGDDLADVASYLAPGRETYSAADVIARLLEGQPGR